jgi:lysine 6-dehydrogenase
VYSLEGALDYYTTTSWILRGGKRTPVDALSELEPVEFPEPVGTLEAFHTAGGVSTMPFSYEGKVDVLEYKTLRYPGHVAIMRPTGRGYLQIRFGQGQPVVPRDVFMPRCSLSCMRRARPGGAGDRGRRPVVARGDLRAPRLLRRRAGTGAMMRTTGYSLSLTGLMQAGGVITAPGVHTPDEAVPFRAYVDGLARFGVRIEERP